MLDFAKSENMKSFEKCIADLNAKEVASMSISIYQCWKLFNDKYGDMPSWKKSAKDQAEWLSYLATLASNELMKETNHELPAGTANGIYMTLFFFTAIASNEGAHTINKMTDYMEKFNRIGYQISQASVESRGFHYVKKSPAAAGVHAN